MGTPATEHATENAGLGNRQNQRPPAPCLPRRASFAVAPEAAPESPTGATVQVRVLGRDYQPLAGVVVYYGDPAARSEARRGLAADRKQAHPE